MGESSDLRNDILVLLERIDHLLGEVKLRLTAVPGENEEREESQ